jgi:multicomponent Na+:H+ antiporter subunit E
MNYIRLRYRLFIVILLFWFLMNFNFKIETILMGIILSAFVTEASFQVLHDENGFLYRSIKIRRLFIYVFVLFYEIFRSSFAYVWNLVGRRYVPIVFDLVLEVDDPVQVGIIANSITLTPGTITIDISDNVIKVMTLAKPGTPIQELEAPIRNRFEKLLKEQPKSKEEQ